MNRIDAKYRKLNIDWIYLVREYNNGSAEIFPIGAGSFVLDEKQYSEFLRVPECAKVRF
jgi:hypothetical protein